MQFAGQTDIGLVRKTNQDAYNAGALSENAVWAVVCDGMGGANGGNIASETAIDAITKDPESCDPSGERGRQPGLSADP